MNITLNQNCSHFKKMDLSCQQKAELVKYYYQNNNSVTEAIRKFSTAHNIKNKCYQPSYTSVNNMVLRFEETASCNIEPHSSRVKDVVKFDCVKQTVISASGDISVRQAAIQSNVSKSYAHNVMKYDLKMHPYKPAIERFLSDSAIEERKQFCEWFLLKKDDEMFMENIFVSDEAMFDTNPAPNRQNCRIWATSRPSDFSSIHRQFPEKIMVWTGFTKKFVIGPYFFEGSVNQDSYREMLEMFLIPQLKSRRVFSRTYFQQDGARPHTAHSVIEFLTSRFGDRLISRNSCNIWPGYSPDLSPVDFALWGYLKGKVCVKTSPTITQLKEKICEAFEEIPQDFCAKSINSMVNRCERCLECDGDIFE